MVTRPLQPVHPRGCGERGCHVAAGQVVFRFIPAGAGNAFAKLFQNEPAAVHPRGCGERGITAKDPAEAFGSSPRVRGTPLFSWCEIQVIRFIPAGAGNAFLSLCRSFQSAVHPRGCGERAKVKESKGPGNGSSPRVRGTLRYGLFARGIFPVHSRGCGERSSIGRIFSKSHGSSPRVRGTLADVLLQCTVKRFIPAGAGNAVFS